VRRDVGFERSGLSGVPEGPRAENRSVHVYPLVPVDTGCGPQRTEARATKWVTLRKTVLNWVWLPPSPRRWEKPVGRSAGLLAAFRVHDVAGPEVSSFLGVSRATRAGGSLSPITAQTICHSADAQCLPLHARGAQGQGCPVGI
jgi:hypothetical protein